MKIVASRRVGGSWVCIDVLYGGEMQKSKDSVGIMINICCDKKIWK